MDDGLVESAWEPRYKAGERVQIVRAGLQAIVIEADRRERAYIVEVNGNATFRLLCTEAELIPVTRGGVGPAARTLYPGAYRTGS